MGADVDLAATDRLGTIPTDGAAGTHQVVLVEGLGLFKGVSSLRPDYPDEPEDTMTGVHHEQDGPDRRGGYLPHQLLQQCPAE